MGRDGETSLSFTLQSDELVSDSAICKYQIAKELGSGDLPGICRLEHEDLARKVMPPLPPRWDPNDEDPGYGHLHCATAIPTDVQRHVMAAIATRYGLVREFVPKKKRIDL